MNYGRSQELLDIYLSPTKHVVSKNIYLFCGCVLTLTIRMEIPFAFLAYHMLTMSFVYFNIWQIRQAIPDDFKKGLIGSAKIQKTRLSDALPLSFSVQKKNEAF